MISFSKERLTKEDAHQLLNDFDQMFSPALSSHIDIERFSEKLSKYAFFILCRSDDEVVGYIAFYENKETQTSYIPSICVKDSYRAKGLASQMMDYLVQQSPDDIEKISLEVRKNNSSALKYYERNGFVFSEDRNTKILMNRKI